MFLFFKIFQEGILLAIQELWSNKLRTVLSLMGISIGIFCVISVWAITESFQAGLKQSFNKIGSNVLHVSKGSWDFQKMSTSWWKYMKRPNPNFSDYEHLQKNMKLADLINIRAVKMGQKLQYKGVEIDNTFIVGTNYDFAEMFDLEVDIGRYFTREEIQMGKNGILLGYEVAETLFPSASFALGKEVKHDGRKLKIIGILKKEGESILGNGFDGATIVPYNYFRKYYNINNPKLEQIISVAGRDDVNLDDVREEIRGGLRASRHLKPKEEDNFEINHLSLLTGMIDSLFAVVSIAGFLIGSFAILVGGFGIANIMFVSVKERTRFIGIKKSLGAKRIYILLEFLTESIILTSLGGAIGLAAVYLLLTLGNHFIESFNLFLSSSNIFWGIVISVIIGIVAGFIPAFQASELDPVEAMRS